jgi:hypothetical protein
MRWGRILAGGFLAELLLVAAVIPGLALRGPDHPSVVWTAVIGSPLTSGLFAWWVGRRLESRFILHGALVGVTASLIYVAITLAQPEPFIYLVAHGLKILGGAAGGVLAGRRSMTAAAGVRV